MYISIEPVAGACLFDLEEVNVAGVKPANKPFRIYKL